MNAMKQTCRQPKGVALGAALTLTLALTLSACATLSPQERSAYAEAQGQVQRLESEPLANQAAGRPLQQAREALSNADNAVRHHDAQDVMYWSYMATHRAEIGEAMVAELHMRNEVADATAERGRMQLDFQRRRTELAQTQAQQARHEALSAQQQLQQEQQREQAEQTQQQLAQVRQQAQQQVQQAQQQQQAAQQAQEQARQQLEALQAKQTSQGMVLTLSGSPMFATGSDTLEPGAIQSLQNVARLMQQHPMMKIRVEGFTDNRGSDEYNDALSQRRAQAVANALESNGIDPSRLAAIGRGKSLPVASNGTAAGRQQNRRVELLFSDTQGRFASAQGGEELR
ncbi:MAG TPA: OmpA family protein [Steroidobacteraceae bacterium]|jgi:outer membrane protein OmpA-like peptidoglycan-associated protein|nr:OmpA family protein [Steroidobacteraceae bacterium]